MKSVFFIVLTLVFLNHLVKCSSDHNVNSNHGYSPPQARNRIQDHFNKQSDEGRSNENSDVNKSARAKRSEHREDIGDGVHDVGHHKTDHHGGGIHLISWKWSEYASAIMFTGMILAAAILKIIFHHLDWLAKILPESCVLIVVGILVAIIINYVILDDIVPEGQQIPFPKFTSELFFNVLLPPIILDSALSLYDRDFFDNFTSIMIFAIFGTLLNVFSIGYSLYGLSYTGVLGTFVSNKTGTLVTHDLQPCECLIFSSLISAVDPVAVLAIFEDIKVHMGLYFLVFGESLFNDGVTVVLYNTMNSLMSVENVGFVETLMAVLSFFFVAVGGAIIGAINGIFASYITTFTSHVQVVEPLIIFSTAYIAFLHAEIVHWSGIISIIAYGITIKRYGLQNLHRDSYTTVINSIKTLASTSDCIIFLFLGVVLFSLEHNFHIGFITATIILCCIFRFLWTFLLSWLVNLKRTHKIEFKEQIIMGYGGLRGAVGFSLAVVLNDEVWYKELFLSAALAMVFFTVFLQGSTIKLLVNCFNIKRLNDQEPLITHDLQSSIMDEIVDGVEIIIGNKTKATGICVSFFAAVDNVLKKVLITCERKEILQNYEKIMLDEHFTNLYAPRIIAEQQEKVTKASQLTRTQTRRTLKQGLQNTHWDKIRRGEPDKSDLRSIVDQLEERRKKTQAMGDQVLERTTETKYIDMLDGEEKNGTQSLERKIVQQKPPLGRSASVNWGALRRASNRTMTMKEEYDKIQNSKKTRINSQTSATPGVNSIEEEHESEETETFLGVGDQRGTTNFTSI